MRILSRVRNRFDVDQFEYLTASADTGLLRLAGRWPNGEQVPEEPVLVALGPLRPARLEPVPPAPAVNGGIWRAAYSAPLSLITRSGLRWQLQADDGRSWALPTPNERGASRTQQIDSRAVAALRDELERAAGERARLTERVQAVEADRYEADIKELRDALQRERERAAGLDAELEAVRAEARALRAVLARREQMLEHSREGVDAFELTLADLEHDATLLRNSVGQMIEVASDRSRPRFSREPTALQSEVDRTAAELAQPETEAIAARHASRARLAEARMVQA